MDKPVRFKVENAPELPNSRVYVVIDTESKRWNTPTPYIPLRMSQISAVKIAAQLNTEWNAFQANPDWLERNEK